MWFFLFAVGLCVSASAYEAVATSLFHKCCDKDQGLVRIVDEGEPRYECIDRESVESDYGVSKSPLIVGAAVPVVYGNPDRSCVLGSLNSTDELNLMLSTSNDKCYDRLWMQVTNGTVTSDISRIISLSCIRDDADRISDVNLALNRIRKCCPKGHSYDTQYHLCKKSNKSITEDALLNILNINSDSVYELETGLRCKEDEYAVELSDELYALKLVGGNLNVVKKDGSGGGDIIEGEWCMEQQFERTGFVARACTIDCDAFGAFCVRKCCPIGQYYRTRRCGSPISSCVPNDDEVPFNMSTYIDPLKQYGIGDIMGVRENLRCPHGKVMLEPWKPRDHHELDQYGIMHSPFDANRDYCLETFDNRHCIPDNLFVTSAICFVKAPELKKNFNISFWLISVSSVCLALTLIVYVSLPELRNLHGRTLICHVSMMLLAFTCLARVQYSLVPDKKICTALGYGIYFGFMAAFAWLNVMCLDIWWTFGSMRTIQPMCKAGAERRRFLWYSLYAWSISFLLTLTMYLLDKYPVVRFLDADIGSDMCWFGSIQNTKTDWPHYIFFVIPMGLGTCTNFVLFMLTARHCSRVKSEVHRLQAGSVGDRVKKRFRVDKAKYVLTGKLWVVMGAGWVSELAATLTSHPEWLWSIVDLFNELQGVFIFLILIFKPKLYYLIRKRLGLEKPDAQKQNGSSARTSSTFLSRTVSSDERATMRVSQGNNIKLQ